MIHAICRACHWMTVVGDQLPHSCERCDSPFFYYRRTTTRYFLTDADREFLRSGGISAYEAPDPGSASDLRSTDLNT